MADEGAELARHPTAHASAVSGEFRVLVQSFLRHKAQSTVRELEWTVPQEWAAAEREAQYWREARACGIFELEMAMAAEILRRLLVQNKYLRGTSIVTWPSRDRHQLWATAWLALRLVPGHVYDGAAFDAWLACRLASPEPSLMFALKSELERRGFVEVSANGAALSRSALDFLLDGDKLFVVRACVVNRRPWWALPLAAQFATAPRSERCPPPCQRFRCVLLDPDGAAGAAASVKFVPVGGGSPVDATSEGVLVEDDYTFPVIEVQFDEAVRVSEVVVTAVATDGAGGTRLPPFRVDGCSNEPGAAARDEAAAAETAVEWHLLQCQPMPPAEEKLNAGRGAVRCFLPFAVPVAPPSSEHVAAFDPLLEGGVLKRWPSKQKQQALATLWLSTHLLPGRLYLESEIDWLIATRFTRSQVPDCPTIRKEFERNGLVEREPGGGGFRLLASAVDVALSGLSGSAAKVKPARSVEGAVELA